MIVQRLELTLKLLRNPANAGRMWMGRELQELVFHIRGREVDLGHPELIAQTVCRHEGFSTEFVWYNLNNGVVTTSWSASAWIGTVKSAICAKRLKLQRGRSSVG